MPVPQAGDKVDPTEPAAEQYKYQSPREAKSLLKKRKDRLEKSNKMRPSNRRQHNESLPAITEASKEGTVIVTSLGNNS